MRSRENYGEVDDAELVRDVLLGNDLAFGRLLERHDRLTSSVALRVLDERNPTGIADLKLVTAAFEAELRRDDARSLAQWSGRCTLRHYLAVLARQSAENHLQRAAAGGQFSHSGLPTPAALFLDDLVTFEPAQQVEETLHRQSPHISALVRLRLRGLDRAAIATSLGMPQPTVISNLERLSARLAELQRDDEREAATLAFRVLLDCAPPSERVSTALHTIDDPRFKKTREQCESSFRSVREREITRALANAPECLPATEVAGFVDGSMPGVERANASVHVATCGRCTDRIAALTDDMRVQGALRDSATSPRLVALSASCVATSRFRAGAQLADAAEGTREGPLLARVARLGMSLEDTSMRSPEFEPSGVRSTTPPAGAEAAVACMEALARNDAREALLVLEGRYAMDALAIRLRLLSQAIGTDVDEARRHAEELVTKPHRDPGVIADAETVRALPNGRCIPREILVERLRVALPDAVRAIVVNR